MVVSEGPGTIGTRIVNVDYPITEGIIAGTTKQKTESPSLEAEVDLTGAAP